MQLLRNHPRFLGLVGRWALLWFMLSLGVAVASPIVHPQAVELVCSSAGSIKAVVQTDDGVQEMGASHMDCPLCLLTGAPPPSPAAVAFDLPLPLGRVLQSIPAARLAAATAAPLPARGPPTFS
ncbi:hypothetical protein J2X90_002930 [Variovorax paradoxus]|uniref:DUF2946 family protein n=1 Tax=Variovorax paradoxus TaxID=34073 RepID=UPI00278B9DD1|nr:DUF2946 family protein [Variovorax paradoxus]MDP9931512.1 hypothetical protein [Variovorax paradoxus]MDQ0025124.1 hypothetical protein [Variovorax paradoxus]